MDPGIMDSHVSIWKRTQILMLKITEQMKRRQMYRLELLREHVCVKIVQSKGTKQNFTTYMNVNTSSLLLY